MSRAGRKPGIPNRTSLLATADMDRLGINPIEMLKQVYDEAMEGYRAGRGVSDKADTGAAWLSVARSAASDLASFKHPKLSAVAIKDLTQDSDTSRPVTTQEAIEIMKQDPFAVKTADVIEQIKSSIDTPKLPGGNNE